MSETPKRKKVKLALPIKLFIGMILGGITGFMVGPDIAPIKIIGDIFIRLLRMCIYPLILFSIISGVSHISDMSRLKRVGKAFFSYWLLTSILAGLLGLGFALLLKPGIGIDLQGKAGYELQDTNLLDSFLKWVPDNPFASLSEGNLIQIIIFAMIAGFVLAGMKGTKSGDLIAKGVEAINELVGKIINWVVSLAPYGVFALIANMTGTLGVTVLTGVGTMLLAIWLSVLLVLIVLYPIILKGISGLNPLQFYNNVFPAMVMAFSTCSSAATLPVTMDVSKKRMGVPDDIVNTIAPPAATINMHATCLEIPIYVLFAANVFGIELTTTQILLTIGMGIISSVGSAALPGGGIVMDAIVLELMGLPLTILPWIVGVYYLIDMPGTMLNVTGDTVGMAVIAERLKEIKRDVFNRSKSFVRKEESVDE